MNPLVNIEAIDAPRMYAVVDRRQDGRARIIIEANDLFAARSAADALRLAGCPAQIVQITVVEGAVA